MSVADRLATLAVAISVLTPMAANAMDDFIAASSRAHGGSGPQNPGSARRGRGNAASRANEQGVCSQGNA